MSSSNNPERSRKGLIIQVTEEDAMGSWLERNLQEVLSRSREPPAWHWVWGW